MIPIIELNNTPDVTASGKAYVLKFVNADGRTVTVWIPLSQSRFDRGMLWVAEWLLEPHRGGIATVIKNRCQAIGGRLIASTETAVEAPEQAQIRKGYFTVEGGGKHRTFKLRTSARTNKTAIGLMIGSSNTADYLWFGYLEGSSVRYWRQTRYHQEVGTHQLPLSRQEIGECVASIVGNADEAGLCYARMYQNCSRCGRVLTTPESLDRGLGPECAGLRYGAS